MLLVKVRREILFNSNRKAKQNPNTNCLLSSALTSNGKQWRKCMAIKNPLNAFHLSSNKSNWFRGSILPRSFYFLAKRRFYSKSKKSSGIK
jgi:hypothetical protein